MQSCQLYLYIIKKIKINLGFLLDFIFWQSTIIYVNITMVNRIHVKLCEIILFCGHEISSFDDD